MYKTYMYSKLFCPTIHLWIFLALTMYSHCYSMILGGSVSSVIWYGAEI